MGSDVWLYYNDKKPVVKWLKEKLSKNAKDKYYSVGHTGLMNQCWIEWKRNKLIIGTQVFHSNFGIAIACEICKSFKPDKFGYGSIGWCKVDKKIYPPFYDDLKMCKKKGMTQEYAEFLLRKKMYEKAAKNIFK